MKKIAIQYSGEIRNLLDCFNNHYENFVLLNPEYEVDIFAHLWAKDWEIDAKSLRISELIKPKSISFEEPFEFNRDDIKQDPRFPWITQNMLSMFYGIGKVNDMRLKYERINKIEYDYVIRIRTDITFMPNCIGPIHNYNKDLIHIKDYTPYTEHGIDYAINDYFAIGSPEFINKYSEVFNNVDKMILDGAAINPECLIGFNIKDIPKQKHNFRMWPHKYIYMYLDSMSGGNLG
jgi:hypothetical protein